MPITVTDPDGQPHTFADGTPTAAINAEMERKWAARGTTPQPAQPTPLQGPGKMPPGAVPGSITPKLGGTLDTPMVELSADAQRGLRMITGGGATNNRNLEQAGRMLLEKDPTYQARKKQADVMGESAGKRAEMRLAGENILGSYSKLLHAFNKTDDDTLKGAIGPGNLKPYQSWVPLIGGMTEPEAAAAYRVMPNFTGASDAQKAWNAQNLFKHDVHGLTNAFVTSSPKGMNMSDSRQAMFESAMGDFMKSTSREEANRILDHAKTIISNDFNVTPQEAESIIKANMARFKQEDEHKELLKAAAKVPPDAVTDLVSNAANPAFVTSFNKHFNGGRPGLAERLIEAHGRQ